MLYAIMFAISIHVLSAVFWAGSSFTLARGIGISGIIVNAMTPETAAACRSCRAAARAEAGELAALGGHARGRRRHAIWRTPALTAPPRGHEALAAWGRRWTRALA